MRDIYFSPFDPMSNCDYGTIKEGWEVTGKFAKKN